VAGYTYLMDDLDTVIEDVKQGKYFVKMIHEENVKKLGHIERDKNKLKFDHVPIIAPNGEVILNDFSFELEQGQNCFIDGPNGAGKTSIFRCLGELWPVYGGHVECPGRRQLFFIPQTAYLPAGNLRDQIIYPDTKLEMLRKGYNDKYIKELLEKVELTELIDKWGLDNPKPWKDIFSGGQR